MMQRLFWVSAPNRPCGIVTLGCKSSGLGLLYCVTGDKAPSAYAHRRSSNGASGDMEGVCEVKLVELNDDEKDEFAVVDKNIT